VELSLEKKGWQDVRFGEKIPFGEKGRFAVWRPDRIGTPGPCQGDPK
jgi:hypothetical protein